MRDSSIEAILLEVARINDWKCVSTDRQLKNGTYVFDFGQPDTTYEITANGYLRCNKLNREHMLEGGLLNHSLMSVNGKRHNISYLDAIKYFVKRFGTLEVGDGWR